MPRSTPAVAVLVAAAIATALAGCTRRPRDGAVVYPPPDDARPAGARGGATPARPAPRAAPGTPSVPGDSLRGRIGARAGGGPRPDSVGLGLQPLGLVTGRGARDGVVFVPAGYRADRPARLMVLLHGEASTPRAVIAPLRALADSAGIILLAPASRGRTWDAIGGGSIGPDVAFVDRAMAAAFARYNVDPGRVTVAGFSEGGSYALMLALANGDLFRRAIAFSPGSIPGALPPVGRPRMFVAHGTRDRVKRVANTRRFVVEELEQRGYDLRFLEFEGGHTIPPEIAETALEWLRVYGG